MKPSRKKKAASVALQTRLSELEELADKKGFHIHYDLLEAAGLKLKGGICRINGEYHIYIDKRKSIAEKIDALSEYLENPLPEDIPTNE
jgi:hypothetical protein